MNRILKKSALIALAVMLTAAAATLLPPPAPVIAQSEKKPCIVPHPPINRAQEPRVPQCLDTTRHTNKCTRAETDQFIREYTNYQLDIADYVRLLRVYVEQAAEFAECKLRELK